MEPNRGIFDYFSRKGRAVAKDKKNKSLFLVYPPGKLAQSEPAEYLLFFPKSKTPSQAEISKCLSISSKLKKELIIPCSAVPPFSFIQIKKIML